MIVATHTGGTPVPPRVLVVAGREPWPLNSGGRLRLYNFLRWLTGNAAVTLALPGPSQHAEHLPATLRVVDVTAAVRTATTRERPVRGAAVPWVGRLVRRHYGTNPAVLGWLEEHARPAHFDVALLYGAAIGQYVDALRVPAVWDAVDELVLTTVRNAEWHGPRRWPTAARAAALYAAYERYAARQARATVFASSVDASYARRWIGNALVETISNGVDFEYFHGPSQAPEHGTVAFIGSLSFPPNVEGVVRFARRIWPRVRAGRYGWRLMIVGREPVDAVRELALLPGVEVHEDVPDVRPYLSEAAVVVVPTRLGGGVKNKVLEACAMRRPVVASPRALAGLSARRGVDVLCAASEAAWVQQVSRLLEQPARAAAIGDQGCRWVRQAHHWPDLTRRLSAVLAWAATGEQPHTDDGLPPQRAANIRASGDCGRPRFEEWSPARMRLGNGSPRQHATEMSGAGSPGDREAACL